MSEANQRVDILNASALNSARAVVAIFKILITKKHAMYFSFHSEKYLTVKKIFQRLFIGV